jgi:hypothetical protein
VVRLHARIEESLGVALPTAHEEAADSIAADERYEEAVAQLRQLTRAGDEFSVLHAENAEYGFRRNLFGLRKPALAVALASGLVAIALLALSDGEFADRGLRWGPAVLASAGAVWTYLRIVNEEWVGRAGERYADRLFEATAAVPPRNSGLQQELRPPGS